MRNFFVQSATRRLHFWGLGAAAIVLAAIGLVSARAEHEEAEALTWLEHTHQVIDSLRRAAADLAEAESDLRGAALSHDLAMLEQFDVTLAEGEHAIAEVRRLTRDNGQQQDRLDDLIPAFDRRAELLREHRQQLIDKGTFAVVPEAVRLTSTIRRITGEMVNEELWLLGLRTTISDHLSARTTLISQVGLGWSLLMVVAALFFFRRYQRAQREIERALASEHQLLQSVVEGTADSVYVKDLAGRYLMINSAAARRIARTPEDVCGKTDLELFDVEVGKLVRAKDAEVVVGGVPTAYEHTAPTASGLRTFSVTKTPVRNANNVITGIVGIAHDVTEQRASSDRKLAHFKLVVQLSEMLQACRTLIEAYDVVAHMAPHFVPGSSGALYVYHSSRNLVEARASWGGERATGELAVFAPEDCWALRRGHAHACSEGELAMPCQHVKGQGPGTTLCLPLLADGTVMGLFHVRVPGALADIMQQATLFVGQMGITLSSLTLRETLRNQSIRDPLTGLFNRRYTEETLNRELSRAAREKGSLAVLAIDVDHFKRFNDSFGHAAGDQVLRELAKLLQGRIRGSDVASRMGGEEMLIILPGSDREGAIEKADRLRDEISRLHVSHLGQALGQVTLSIGVAHFPEHGNSADELTRAADAALYRAKSKGRNCVVAADSEPTAPVAALVTNAA